MVIGVPAPAGPERASPPSERLQPRANAASVPGLRPSPAHRAASAGWAPIVQLCRGGRGDSAASCCATEKGPTPESPVAGRAGITRTVVATRPCCPNSSSRHISVRPQTGPPSPGPIRLAQLASVRPDDRLGLPGPYPSPPCAARRSWLWMYSRGLSESLPGSPAQRLAADMVRVHETR
jgi:hypothetical protein